MKTSDFYFDLPESQIAQTPIEPRSNSRMLCMNRNDGSLAHRHFYELPSLLRAGDTLVINTSRVLPARLFGVKERTGGAMQFLLLEQKQTDVWEVMVKPGKKAKMGARFVFGDGLLTGEILDTLEGGNRLVRFYYEGNFYQTLEQIGKMPLPPYITETLKDNERYQTVYSKQIGSAAAPTAGLHFTPELLDALRQQGINIAEVVLHVGLGTFRPVKVEDISAHHMHSEHYHLPAETAAIISQTKANGGRVIAIGTTSCRTLESVAAKHNGQIVEDDDDTSIFIYPGFQFRAIDGLITNFHLPESTLIMLVSAFAGYKNTMSAYQAAVREGYRFFSFGDAMAIL